MILMFTPHEEVFYHITVHVARPNHAERRKNPLIRIGFQLMGVSVFAKNQIETDENGRRTENPGQ